MLWQAQALSWPEQPDSGARAAGARIGGDGQQAAEQSGPLQGLHALVMKGPQLSELPTAGLC
jgi:hypothetical protein